MMLLQGSFDGQFHRTVELRQQVMRRVTEVMNDRVGILLGDAR